MNVPRILVFVAVWIGTTIAKADGRVSGHVLDAGTREPVTSARVRLEGPALRVPLETGVDLTGFYRFEVPAGRYLLTFTDTRFAPHSRTVEVRTGASLRINEELCTGVYECCLAIFISPQRVDVGSAAQQPDVSPFVPEKRAWGSSTPSRPLVPPRME